MSQTSSRARDTSSNSSLVKHDNITSLNEYTDYTADSSSFISNPDGFPNAELETISDQEFADETDASDLNSNKQNNNENSSDQAAHSFSSNTSEHDHLDDISDLKELDCFAKLSLENSETSLKHDDHISTTFEANPSARPRFAISGSTTNKLDSELSNVHKSDLSKSVSPFVSNPNTPKVSLRETNPTSDKQPEQEPEFQNSSFLDETRTHFDIDFDLDGYQATEKRQQDSPWRNFRPSLPPQSSFHHNNLLSRRDVSNASTAGVASTEKIEHLSKQLTNCKIQLKLYEKFLQDLIDKQSVDVSDVTTLQSHLDYSSSMRSGAYKLDPIPEKSSSEKDLSDMAALVEDLYASLEESQAKWRDADHRFSELNKKVSGFSKGATEAFKKSGIDVVIPNEEGAVSSSQIYLDQILNLLKESVERNGIERNRLSIPAEITEPQSFSEKSALDGTLTKGSESRGISTVDTNVDHKLQEYQDMINRLQKEVNELKDRSRVSSTSDLSSNTYLSRESGEKDRYTTLQKEFERLQVSHHDLIDEHHRYKMASEHTIVSLKVQAETFQKDNLSLRSRTAGMANIEHDLQASIEKQRIISTEKIKLSYLVESLKQDKLALGKNLDRLTQKLAASSENSGQSADAMRKKSQHVCDLVDRIFEVDMRQFESLLKSFNKIADDASLEEPRQKIAALGSNSSATVSDLKHNELLTVEQAHKSVQSFFSRAVDVIVNDHIRLLLKDNERKTSYEKNVTELRKYISELEERNKQLKERPEYMPSPRSKLRIEELTNRWKSEREARILENRQAKKRLHEMEQDQKSQGLQ